MKVRRTGKIIILGNLKCRVGKSTDSQIVGSYGEDTKNDNGVESN